MTFRPRRAAWCADAPQHRTALEASRPYGATLPALNRLIAQPGGEMPLAQRRRSTAALVMIATLLLLLTALVRPVSAAHPTPRIINGGPASLGEYPFMAAL